MAITKKAVTKSSVTKATTTKKVAAKKTATVKKQAPATKEGTVTNKAPVAPAKPKSIAARQTKMQILQAIAEETSLTRKQVSDVFNSLGTLVQRHMQRRGSGEFSIPETGVKIRRVRKPARKARMGRNPATGEVIKIAAKPASTVIKVVALKALKDTLD
ncbi:MAG: HU family DNA-binding protein [Chromatiaceae bacterium]|nr:HU family DNA-binding protein [Gammaproteobacteria bacterium]MCP5427162.1 HU family DNA-binding protein [Chromatiaceae bacterium]MCB1861330.1 HU family DNA-binding protein [Gammaproteobacteria bacterium]MCB1870687.1 HU family DNA-binding protein [Gammaproteobacteria bacterium]MCB1882188.1 HU family DNA-binding protein [Gammaproteobacteria bacterium]